MADRVFDRLAHPCPHLGALAINASQASIMYDVNTEPCGFLRAKQVDLYGKMTHVRVPVEAGELRFHVPFSDILEEETLVTC